MDRHYHTYSCSSVCSFVYSFIPPIQNFLREKATTIASEATGWEIGIERISLSFPLNLVVKGVEVVDKQDTLLTAGELMVKVQLWPLIKKQVEVNGIGLQNVKVNSAGLIDGMRIEGSLGDFFLESHGVDLDKETVTVNKVKLSDTDLRLCLNDTTESKPDTTSTPLKWKILLHQLSLDNIAFALQMPADSLNLYARINSAMLQKGEVDLGTELYQLALLKLSDSEVHYDSGNGIASAGFDPSHIIARNINIRLDSLKYHGQNIMAQIRQFTLDERSGLSVTSLKGNIKSDSTSIRIPDLRLETPYSFVDLSVLADWATVYKPETGVLSVQLNADFGKEDVLLFTGHLSDDFKKEYPFRPLVLRADIKGNMQELKLNELRAELPGAFRLAVEGNATSVLDSINRKAFIDLDASTGNLDFVLSLLDAESRDNFAIPHDMSLTGEAKMNGEAYHANLAFAEGVGKILLNASYDGKNQAYSAALDIDSLQLTDFMPKDSLYMLTASVAVKGEGLDFYSPKTRVNAELKVDAFSYAIYDLSGIQLTASLEKNQATVLLDSHNPLVDLQARLNALLHKNQISADLDMNVANINFYRMHMTPTPFDVALNFRVKASTDMKITHSLDGAITDMRMKTEKQNFKPKNIYFEASTGKDSTLASVSAGDLKVSLEGVGDIERIMKESNRFMEVLTEQLAEKRIYQNELRKYLPGTCIRITAGTDNPLSNYLAAASGIGFHQFLMDMDTSPEEGLNGNSYIYALHTDSLQLDTIRLDIHQDTTGVKFAAGVVNGPDNKQIVFKASADGEIHKRGAELLLKYFNDKGENGVLLGIRAVLHKNGMSFHLFPEHPTIVFRPFNVNKKNYVYIGKDNRVRADVSVLDSAGTGLKLYSLPDTTVLQDIAVELRRIELADICEVMPYMPKISILVPLWNNKREFQIQMLDCVMNQTYPNWELCLADGSDAEHSYIEELCREYAAKANGRIVYKHLDHNGGISYNTNECYKLATGDYIGLFDQDDILHPSVLYAYVKEINEQGADYLYCDETTFKENDINKMLTMHFKPDYAPDNLRANNYICHFSVFSRKLLEGEELFRTAFDGAQDHDMILRLTDRAEKIVHVPRLMYYWRSHEGSTAASIDAKPYAIEAAKGAVADHLKKHGFKHFQITSTRACATIFRIRYQILGDPKISIVIANKDHVEDLKRCITSIQKNSTWSNYEIIVVENCWDCPAMILMKKDASCIPSAAMTAVSCTAGTDGFPL